MTDNVDTNNENVENDDTMEMLPISEVGVGRIKSAIGQPLSDVVWPVGTEITLCNVPWDGDYCNVVAFDDQAALDGYFDGLGGSKTTLDRMVYAVPGMPVRVDIPYHEAYTFNYMIVRNPALPVKGEDSAPQAFYYFIEEVEYLAPSTTQLDIMLDVWTTYQFAARLGRCYVERGHAAMHACANTALPTAAMKRRYLSAPEGLDVGSSYTITAENIYTMGGGLDGGATAWTIVITSAVKLEGKSADDFGTADNPKMEMADGMIVDGVPGSCAVYGLEPGNFLKLVAALSEKPWISNNILSITAIPEGAAVHDDPVSLVGVPAYKIASQAWQLMGDDAKVRSYPSGGIDGWLKGNVTDKWAAHPKARVYPFSYISADNLCGTPLLLKPELCHDDALQWSITFCVYPAFQRIFVFPINYDLGDVEGATSRTYSKYKLGDTSASEQTVPYGNTLNNALVWNDFPQFSILNDSYINYMATNANQRNYNLDLARWSLDRSKAYANTTYGNAMRSINAASAAQGAAYKSQMRMATDTLAGHMANSVNKLLGSASRAGSGAGASALSSAGLGGLGSGLASGGKSYANAVKTTTEYTTGAAQAAVQQKQFDLNKAAERKNASANKKLADWAAQGDYQMAVQSVNASCQDAQLLPPTQSGTSTGGMYAVLGAMALSNWYLMANTVSREYQESIADYWNRYGYVINEYMALGTVKGLKVMSKLSYWRCQDCTVTGEIGEPYRMALKGILEKGVTVYGDPDDIEGGIDVLDDNEPLAGDPLY